MQKAANNKISISSVLGWKKLGRNYRNVMKI